MSEIIYEWTPEILKKVRKTCRYCAEEQANVWKNVINHKLAVDNLCKKYPSFPRKKYERKKLSFTDEEYLELRNTAKKKNLPNEIILQLDNYFDHSFFLAYGYAKNGLFGGAFAAFNHEANVLGYLEVAYYVDWVQANSSKPQVDYGEIKYGTVLNKSISWPDTALVRLGISKEEKSLE